MNVKAFIFSPNEKSLQSRCKTLQGLLLARRNVRISQQMVQSDGWSERLGTPAELEFAQEVTQNSIQAELKHLSLSDLEEARHQKFLSEEYCQECFQLKAHTELEQQRENSKNHSKGKTL